ncbi:fibrinogen-like protein 1 [Lampris incognitus]|uniref:fibrinogen-like protein 1 n=1 Tax=Lampris incognitus TaxID=2546036 RepID=UPI0024B50C6B|nr:fibrinogen-like protein 1 [Lampris incognitus]
MGVQMFALIGLMVVTAGSPSPAASDSCQEVTRLRQQEKILKSRLLKQEHLLRRLQQLNQTQPAPNQSKADRANDTRYRDCSEVFSSGSSLSGFYNIQPHGSPSPIKVYCDMNEGGGWTVIQRRTDGKELFNRSWAEYKVGFGDMQSELGEFWLGNENLHYLTAQGDYCLRINLEDFEGNQRYAEYNSFKVGPETEQYKLTFGVYSGTAGDSLSGSFQADVSEWASHQGMKFSTYDQDNDNHRGNCAREDKGGWWFNRCHSAHLNGLYYPRGYYSALTDDGVVWYAWKGWWYSLKTSVMQLRPTDFKIDPIYDVKSFGITSGRFPLGGQTIH